MAKDLDVYFHGDRVGEFRQEDSGRLSFRYSATWLASPRARQISYSLPLREEGFGDREARPYFAGLLPDELVRERLARHLGISRRNDFALLAEIGGECAGAISLHSPTSGPPEYGSGELVPLLESRLATLLRDLPKRPLLVGGELRLSLAGAQDKMAIAYLDGQFFMPRGDRPTTHILKPAIQHFSGTVLNEYFSMHLASLLGLRVAAVAMGRAEDVEYLLVERYDRKGQHGRTTRLHQEDFCQALGIAPERKYQSEGGPSFAQCFELLAAFRRPAVDRLELLRRVLFNFLIGNADAHGKNSAILHPAEGMSLAPAYDLLSTLIYPEHTDRMAMKIGGKNRFDEVLKRHWQGFSKEVGLAAPRVLRDLGAMATAIPGAAQHLAEELERQDADGEILDKILGLISARSSAVLASL